MRWHFFRGNKSKNNSRRLTLIEFQGVFNGTRMTLIERIITDGLLAQGCFWTTDCTDGHGWACLRKSLVARWLTQIECCGDWRRFLMERGWRWLNGWTQISLLAKEGSFLQIDMNFISRWFSQIFLLILRWVFCKSLINKWYINTKNLTKMKKSLPWASFR